MPSTSEAQRKFMAIALGIKRGETPASYSEEAAKIAESMTEQQLEDFASKCGEKTKKSLDAFNEYMEKKVPREWKFPGGKPNKPKIPRDFTFPKKSQDGMQVEMSLDDFNQFMKENGYARHFKEKLGDLKDEHGALKEEHYKTARRHAASKV